MVIEAGSLEIKGTIDIGGIKSGLSDMRREMEKAKSETGGLFGQIVRLGKEAGFSAKSFLGLGLGIAGSLTALAITFGPRSQIAMERFKIAAQNIGFITDRVVGPALNTMADLMLNLIPIIDNAVASLENFKGAQSGLVPGGFLGGVPSVSIGEPLEFARAPAISRGQPGFGIAPSVAFGEGRRFGGAPSVVGFSEPLNISQFIEGVGGFFAGLGRRSEEFVTIQANHVTIEGGGTPTAV